MKGYGTLDLQSDVQALFLVLAVGRENHIITEFREIAETVATAWKNKYSSLGMRVTIHKKAFVDYQEALEYATTYGQLVGGMPGA